MHDSFLTHEKYRYLWISLVLLVGSITAYVVHQPVGVPNGGTKTQNFTLISAPQSGCVTDNSQSLFQRGVPTNCDLTTVPGTVQLTAPDNTATQNTTVTPAGFSISNTAWAGQTFTPTLEVGGKVLADFGPDELEVFLKENQIEP